MVSVMGLTWILGIAANVKALSFFWYPYAILNSLQGMFCFTSSISTYVSNFFRNNNILDLWKVKHVAGGIDSYRRGLENENLT